MQYTSLSGSKSCVRGTYFVYSHILAAKAIHKKFTLRTSKHSQNFICCKCKLPSMHVDDKHVYIAAAGLSSHVVLVTCIRLCLSDVSWGTRALKTTHTSSFGRERVEKNSPECPTWIRLLAPFSPTHALQICTLCKLTLLNFVSTHRENRNIVSHILDVRTRESR